MIDVVPCGGSHSTTGTNSRCKDPEKAQAGPGRALVREPGIKGGPGGEEPKEDPEKGQSPMASEPIVTRVCT